MFLHILTQFKFKIIIIFFLKIYQEAKNQDKKLKKTDKNPFSTKLTRLYFIKHDER